ncbi:MAG: FAD-dependent oxidoreductase [Dehalococcoidia bacterium]
METKASSEVQLMPPCQYTCPLHQDVRGYIALTVQGRLDEAAELIRQDNPLPSILGMICAHPCENECRRKQVESALSIRGLKRYVIENAPNPYAAKPCAPPIGKKVAVIGSGPAGLTAAHDLALAGCEVTVFERSEDFGGMVRWGVPSYRLPVEKIRKDVDAIAAMGVQFKPGVELGKGLTIDQLENEGYHAVILALGLPDSRALPIPNKDHKDVLMAIPFLRAARLGETMIRPGANVIVIGSGDVAMDVARTAVREGAGQVRIVCLEKRHEMPASPWEIDEAQEEGVIMEHLGWGPNAVLVNDRDQITGLECRECTAVFDEQGRFNPCYNDANLSVAEGDTVIFSIGQGAIIDYLKDMNIELNERGQLIIDRQTFMTSRKGVFSGGEVAKGPGPAVEAMVHARRAARAVLAWLKDEPIAEEAPIECLPELEESTYSQVKSQPRQELHLLPVKERSDNFTPIETGFTPEEAVCEARRCMSCGAGAEWIRDKCAFCLNCLRVCPYDVPVITESGRIDIRVEQCQGCGICFPACPGKAIGFGMLGVAEIQSRLKVAIDEAKGRNGGPTIAVIYCDFDAYDITNLRQMMKEKHVGKALVGIPCLAKLSAIDLMRAFEYGADGVLAIGCPGNECAYQEGEYWGQRRVDEARRLLAEMGMADRLEIYYVSGLDLEQFDARVAEFTEKIKGL